MSQGSQDEVQTILYQAMTALNALSHKIATPDGEQLLHPVDAELRRRRRREQKFKLNYFGDPAWDILLELERAQRLGHQLAVTDIGVEPQIPLTTVLRYLARLDEDGLIDRRTDPRDRRRIFVSLTSEGNRLISDVFGIEPPKSPPCARTTAEMPTRHSTPRFPVR